MADNITVTQGSGTTIATESISGVNYQKVKLIDPTALSTTGIGISSNPLYVNASAGTNLNTSLLALESGGNLAILAGTVTSSVLQINNKQVNGVAVSTGTGPMGTGVQRVAIASDNDPLIVKQATAANLNATVVGTGTFVTQSTLAAETTKVIGTARIIGNGGATLDSTVGAGTAPANQMVVGALYNSTEISPTNGQAFSLQADSKGRLRNVIMDAAGNTRGANVNASSQLSVSVDNTVTVGSHAVTNAGTFAVQAAGDTASGSSDAGNPVKIGGVGKTANPTAVTDGQRVNSLFDKLGKQVVVGAIRDLKSQQQTTITSSTAETTVATAVASTFLDVYGVIVTNTSATVTKVTFKDSTSGTTRFVIEVPATDTRGFMLPVDSAIPQATVNTNWTATCGTSVASVEITLLFVKNI